MATTLDQQKEAAYTLLSGMLTSVLQKEWKITDRQSAQSALLDALLPKPAPAPTAPAPIVPIKAQKQSIFRLGNRTFDLGPERDSEASSSDDDNAAPIRNARQLKSEMRRVNAIQRRAKRRAERGRRRIEMHLGRMEGVLEFETETPTVKTTKSVAGTPVRMVKELEDYNSPARVSLSSDKLMSPRSVELSSTASEGNREVEGYDSVDSPISEPVQAPGRLRGYSYKACDITTQYYHSWTRHFRGVMHMEKVAGSTQRKGPNIKFVKKAAKSLQSPGSVGKDVNKAPGKLCATEQYCDACDRVLLKCHWKRHAVSAMHAINVKNKAKRDMLKRGSKAKEEEESVRLHAPTPESVVLSVEEEEQKEEEEEEYEDDGFGEEGYEDYGHYCDDCDVTYAGAKWARHLTSAGHVFNVLRNTQGDESMASDDDDEEEEEESMADYDSATDGESIVYDDATDEDSASPSPSPSISLSPSPSSAVPKEGIAFPHDGPPVADLASPPSLTSSPTSPASLPPSSPSTPTSAEFTSEEDFYCETCKVTILSADSWEVDEHVADHAYGVGKEAEVTGARGDWLSQLREAAGWVKDVEVEDMEGVMEVEQGGMECEYNGWEWRMGTDGKVLGSMRRSPPC